MRRACILTLIHLWRQATVAMIVTWLRPLQGCRPYIAMDTTHLTGRSRGQLAIVVAVDGHN
jgi:hypothetical protein